MTGQGSHGLPLEGGANPSPSSNVGSLTLTADQLERLKRIADHGPLVVGTRTTERVIGESGVRSLERRGFVLRFTVNPKRVSGMVRITSHGRSAIAAAQSRLQLFDEDMSPVAASSTTKENVA